MHPLEIVKIIFSSLFVLFLPGFTLSFVFFSQGKIDLLERLALSFALSISVVPLLAFYANLAGIPIRLESVLTEVLLIVFSSVAVMVYRKDLKWFSR